MRKRTPRRERIATRLKRVGRGGRILLDSPSSVAARKAKGRMLQQFLEAELTRRFKEFGIRKGDFVSRPMASPGEDIIVSPKAREVVNISWECKNTKAKAGLKEINQAKANCP